MPPKTRRTPNTSRTELPTTNEELAQLISEHVNAALERQIADLGTGRGRGCGNLGGGTNDRIHIGSSSENQVQGCTYKTFQAGLVLVALSVVEGHFKKDCPKLKVPNARGRTFEMNELV
ncbi:hypothetical protein L1987_20153 [Smallanthus sonchifolius]|uniref:Uncharacterized protein n=1 Tax=Smallanthus sonchifolius TaxID=185202 RepID=A0ACB9ISQ8_9ASTR|nr:hypothetical protein L1987_20153 [Smallanthus sonchifolius]